MKFSAKINRLKTHPFRHFCILKVFLFVSLVNFQIHLIDLIAIGTILTGTVLAALDSFCKARTIFFVAFGLLACAIRQSILLDCL
jgi:hypothetical protein